MGDPGALPALEADPLRPVSIMFTSGTTSKPKAVVHTHGNVLWSATVNPPNIDSVSYTHLRAHETVLDLVCRLLLEKKKQQST